MWSIRFFNGKLKGQKIPLKEGDYIIGRSEECQIVLAEYGISKKHAKLEIHQNEIFISDLQSSNGTYINGVQIQDEKIKIKDKISLYNITFDIIQEGLVPSAYSPPQQQQEDGGGRGYLSPQQTAHHGHSDNPPQVVKLTLKNWFYNYLDKVVLPGIYKLPVWLEFKWVIACFLIFFVVMMTALSAIPLIRILNSSVAQESMNHAESIATTLANINKAAIKDGLYTATSVDYAIRRPGVKKAFIIKASNGKIISPAERAHSYIKLPFAHSGRKKESTSVKQLNSSTVAAMVPIQFYNIKTNLNRSEAYAVVLYDTGTLSFGNKRTISLLVQTCFIAMLLGILMFFFLYKMIEFPIISLNKQLNLALTDNSISVQTNYQFTALNQLTSNINSALSRIIETQEENQNLGDYDRVTEMNHLIEMIAYPTLGINMENMKIEAISPHFEEDVGVSAERILNTSISDIEDQALKQNLNNLIEKVQQHSHEIALDSLAFSGIEFNLSAKGVYGKESLAYTLISFLNAQNPEENE